MRIVNTIFSRQAGVNKQVCTSDSEINVGMHKFRCGPGSFRFKMTKEISERNETKILCRIYHRLQFLHISQLHPPLCSKYMVLAIDIVLPKCPNQRKGLFRQKFSQKSPVTGRENKMRCPHPVFTRLW